MVNDNKVRLQHNADAHEKRWRNNPYRERSKRLASETNIQKIFSDDAYNELTLTFDPTYKAVYCTQNHRERPNFTMNVLNEMLRMQHTMHACLKDDPGDQPRMQYWVHASSMRNVFNFGGDLVHFVDLLMDKDRDGMAEYAKAATDACYNNYRNFDLPITTIALCKGDTLGGGLEAALSCDVIIAERSAQMGLPEIIFGLFPGMGAYSFISRKAGPRIAMQMVQSGRVYSAAELHAAGLVDILAEDGEGDTALRDYFHKHDKRFLSRREVFRMPRVSNPVSYDEMLDIADRWVETAMTLNSMDLKKMRRLARAQLAKSERNRGGSQHAVAAQ
ncbi:MAG: crotonase/enoyl-CoA hydratase family protein [Pseudomonadota bacterium]